MSRIRTLHITAVLVAGAVSLSATLLPNVALAQCSTADLCSQSECSLRQSVVHPTCDQPRSCATIPASNRAELQRRLTINEQCLTAREDVSACFSNSDTGHDTAIQAVRNAIATCQLKLFQD